ncbi:SICA antigen [Plasmodium coatneyi]|uniref:SICA antigen n=1 Tax=Plasmodium coatneyi TaxID=208452 RepID=A0A1B1DZ41_9APIC|nr:SICA antigen [Plasmodium coatneyi]ANQ08072.1 SICA antigen [Plasmodium coatneyi]
MEALCTADKDTSGINMEPYKDFCKIMMRNILMVTDKKNQYENGGRNCQRTVQDITLCELLRVWMYYMAIFCIPEAVIQYVLSVVKVVRKILNKSQKYAECAYEAALRIAYTGKTYNLDDPYYELFDTYMLFFKIMNEATSKEWCVNRDKWQQRREAPPGADPARTETEVDDKIKNGNKEFEDLKEIILKVKDRVEEKKKKPETESASTQPQPPPQAPAAAPPEEEETSQDKTQEGEKKPEQTTSDAETPEGEQEVQEEEEDPVFLFIHSLQQQKTLKPKMKQLLKTQKEHQLHLYLLLYFAFLGKRRKRYRRAHQVRGPPTLEEQPLDHVDQDDGSHEYTLIKERKPPSIPIKRMKKQGLGRRPGRRRGVRRRMIIDIHLEVLDECQREYLHSKKEDFFEILVQEFMGCEFIKEERVPMVDVPKEQVQCSDSGFREEWLCS